ncbi:hypothetical protein GCM10009664_72050 [Kitasatospora gansuensis]
MTTLTGSLHAPAPTDFTGYRVTARYDRTVLVDEATEADLTVRQSTAAGPDGRWRIDLDAEPVGALTLAVRAANGVEVGSLTITEPGPGPFTVELTDTAVPVLIEPGEDPALGRPSRLTGRALQPGGAGVPAELPVVLWGRVAEGSPLPLLVAATTDGGYFAGDWPGNRLDEAWGTVAGGAPVPVRLEDGRLPRVVLLVLTAETRPPQHAEEEADGCGCHATATPRTPGQADLAADPAAYSADLGTGQCVSLTTPNRTIEEVVLHAVVRTTEPEIKGTTLGAPTLVPKSIADRLAQLGALTVEEAPVEARAARRTLRLDAGVTADQLRTGEPGAALQPAELARAGRLTEVRELRGLLGLFGGTEPGRVTLDAHHQVDWDEDPTVYQATTIALGHLLTLKQVWRADGYSLGDLLYSLPLAPGQKKQIAIVDWERREATARRSTRTETEQLTAALAHDRDISEIMNSALAEHSRGSSSARVSAFGGGIGGFVGPIVFGGGGGTSSAGSTAHSHNWRDVSADVLNQARDRTQQSASLVRGQRATTVQTTTQGESLRAQTEVVANYNHCHALSMEYFEVLRHFQVSTELADVAECLFIPFELTPFTPNKALRWREPLSRALHRRDLAGGFAALERIRTGWATADVPAARYADEPVVLLDGDLELVLSLPRPADDDNDHYMAANWQPWAALLQPHAPQDVWTRYLGTALPAQRDRIWDERLAPTIAAALVNSLRVELRLDGGSSTVPVPLDPTLVSPFRQDQVLRVSLQPELTTTSVVRDRISAVRLSLSAAVPFQAKVVARTGSVRYRTEHLSHHLFAGYRIDHELSSGLTADIGVHLDRTERRNPRKEDTLLGARLVAHLNERLEYHHQAVWRAMDANRRFLLLDGFLAPGAQGRSVASVVENRLVAIVGNCLVMPVVPGLHLDPGYRTDPERKATLLDLYATDAPPPVRISVPTKGVFAEAVLGACNSCEKKDDTRFWRWEESPVPEQPMAISTVSTASRRGAPPELGPDAFPDPVVGYQQVPGSPDPTGLAAALKLIGTPNVFRDLTGLDLNQQASAAAFSKALETAQFFGTQAGNLAQQRYANREMDRNLQRVRAAVDDKLITPEQGRELTETFIRSGTGKGADSKPAPSATPAVRKAIERAADSGRIRVSRPSGSVDISSGDRATGAVDFDVDPPVGPVTQTSPSSCWAAAGAMLLGWWRRQSLSAESAADELGAGWRAKLDGDQALTASEMTGYAAALGLAAESPMCYLPRGLLRLLEAHGPLWVIGDDAIDGDALVHVRIVTGIHGDGSPDGTRVSYLDPADGQAHEEPFAVFAQHLEAGDAAALNLGIHHY